LRCCPSGWRARFPDRNRWPGSAKVTDCRAASIAVIYFVTA
jgi:hypothetical protein